MRGRTGLDELCSSWFTGVFFWPVAVGVVGLKDPRVKPEDDRCGCVATREYCRTVYLGCWFTLGDWAFGGGGMGVRGCRALLAMTLWVGFVGLSAAG